ncbi:hypothetical protein ESCO_006405 [Escovopsis weberi]|uniref:Uncharacterized protein n=1 Tax=Escovopsis weberi TaxID=150374 RepID=A0A0M9VS16_ESCWE|nr:hypothetical protein ESCO_006405 [Escovopsis weberi]
MPSSFTQSEVRPRQESWPPTQVRFSPSLAFKKRSKGGLRPLLEDIDENPLTYFLTPMDCDDMSLGLDDNDMYFDAGIEDASQPREAIRSLSPSSLEGLRKSSSRAMSLLDFDSDVPTTDDDDDEEYYSYSHFSPSPSPSLSPSTSTTGFSPLRDAATSVHGFHFDSRRPMLFGPTPHAPRQMQVAPSSSAASTSTPASSSRRGRPSARTPRWQGRGPAATLSARSRPNHLWREPSSSVWSIEEETQEELMSEASSDAGFDSSEEVRKVTKTSKKKVRFVLPIKE